MSNNLIAALPVKANPRLEQRFRVACREYQRELKELNDTVARGALAMNSVKQCAQKVREAEFAAVIALQELVAGRSDEAIIMTYFKIGAFFFNLWGERVQKGIDPLDNKRRRDTKEMFGEWKASEQAYARARYRTISFEDWLGPRSVTADNSIRPSAICLMAILRNEDEAPVFHAVEMQRQFPRLKI
jgi:hypothetical protein